VTNRELLNTPRQLLGELDRQRLHLLRVEGTAMPCPACQVQTNVFDAASIDVDVYDFGSTRHEYRCPNCAARLEQFVPCFPGSNEVWYWALNTAWLQELLRKAREFDRQHPPS
jgi:hypothetical protein